MMRYTTLFNHDITLMYYDGMITILIGNRIIDRFEVGELSNESLGRIADEVGRISKLWFNRKSKLRAVRELPIY